MDPRVIKAVQHFSQANKPIAAICHAPSCWPLPMSSAAAGFRPILPVRRTYGWRGGSTPTSTLPRPSPTATSSRHPPGRHIQAWMRQFLAVLGTKITL